MAEEKTYLASEARTATPTKNDLGNTSKARGVVVTIDVTAVTSTPSVVFTIQGKDSTSGKYYDLLASAAVATVSTVVLRVYPGLTAAANLVASNVIPRVIAVNAVHGNANSITYSVGVAFIQ